MLLALVIFLGAGFGGSFVGGVIYGETRAENAGDELSPRLGPGGQFGGGQAAGAGGGQRGQGRQGQGGAFAGARGQGEPATARQDVGSTTPSESQNADQQAGNSQPATSQRRSPGQDNQAAPGPQEDQSESGPEATEVEARGSTTAGEQSDVAAPAGFGGRGGAQGTVTTFEGDMLTLATPRGDQAVALSEATMFYRISEASRAALTDNATVRISGTRSPEGELNAQAVIVLPEGAENLLGATGGPGGRLRGGGP